MAPLRPIQSVAVAGAQCRLRVLWSKVQRLIYDDQPYTFIAVPEEITAIDDRFYGGAMPPGVKAAIYDALVQIDDAEERARTALFLATTAFQFQVGR